MGYSYRNNGQITDFWPDDTEDCFYLTGDWGLDAMVEFCKEKWGDAIDLTKIRITSEHIHTSCLTYDSYDSSDYTNFIVIERDMK